MEPVRAGSIATRFDPTLPRYPQAWSKLECRDHVLNHGRLHVQVHTSRVETQPLDARVTPVAALPQALAGATNTAAFLRADTAEAARPRAGAARAHLDDADDRSAARDDVDLERSDAEVPRDDVVTVRY